MIFSSSARVRFTSSSSLHALLDQVVDRPHVLLLGRADRLVLVGVDQRADALVREHLAEQPFLLAAVDDVDALDAFLAGPHGVASASSPRPATARPGASSGSASASCDRHLADDALRPADAALGRQVDELHRPQRLRDLDGDGVGVQAVRVPGAVDPDRRHDRDDVVFEQRLQQPDVDPLDPAGELVIDAAEDAGRVRDDRVRAGRRAGRWRTALRGSRA